MSFLLRVRRRLKIPGLTTRAYLSKGGLYLPERSHVVDPRRNVLAVLRRPTGEALLFAGANIVTDAGDEYFAQRACGESPTNAFTTWELFSAGTPGKGADRSDFTPIASTQQVQDGGYPQSDDADADNPGADVNVRTSRVSYTASSFAHAAITHGGITNATPGGTELFLACWEWDDPIAKTTADTLKCFHNASASGV